MFRLQFVCWFLSQLSALWENRHILSAVEPAGDGGGGEAGATFVWRPWEHIQPHPKGTPAPQVNPAGKYCVRLYWMVSNVAIALQVIYICTTIIQ